MIFDDTNYYHNLHISLVILMISQHLARVKCVLFAAPKVTADNAEGNRSMPESTSVPANQSIVTQPLKVKKIILKRPSLVTALTATSNEVIV